MGMRLVVDIRSGGRYGLKGQGLRRQSRMLKCINDVGNT